MHNQAPSPDVAVPQGDPAALKNLLVRESLAKKAVQALDDRRAA